MRTAWSSTLPSLRHVAAQHGQLPKKKDKRVPRPSADEDALCPRPALLPLVAEPAYPLLSARDCLPLLVVLPDILMTYREM